MPRRENRVSMHRVSPLRNLGDRLIRLSSAKGPGQWNVGLRGPGSEENVAVVDVRSCSAAARAQQRARGAGHLVPLTPPSHHARVDMSMSRPLVGVTLTLLFSAAGLSAQVGTLASSTPFGSGCRATGQGSDVLATGTPPVIGAEFCVDVANGPASTAGVLLLGPNYPLPIPIPGAPGCNAYVQLLITLGIATNGAGAGQLCLDIPTDGTLDGGAFSTQWVLLDIPANRLGLVTSNGVAHVVGVLPQMTITGINATTFSVADPVVLQGANQPRADDTCAVIHDPVTGDFAWLKPAAQAPATFTVFNAPATGIPQGRGELTIMRGTGFRPTLQGTPRLSAPTGARTWDAIAMRQNVARLPGVTVNPPPPAAPCVTVNWTVDTANNRIVCTLPAAVPPCAILAYPVGMTMTTDVHPDVICPGSPAPVHYDFFMEAVRVISGTPVFFGQAAAEHAQQIDASVQPELVVDGSTFDGIMTITHVDPLCVFRGPHGRIVGKTIVCCP